MRIIYVTAGLPYGPSETFILPEIKELIRLGHEVMLVPVHARGPVIHEDAASLLLYAVSQHLLSRQIVFKALAESVCRCRSALRAFGWLFMSRSLLVCIKNLAVYPKGLWLASRAREWRADHIHAHWASTPTTMAMIAGEVAGIPFSFTAHRGDIADPNLLGLKVRKASFARFISENGLDMVRPLSIPELDSMAVVLRMGVELGDVKTAASAPAQEGPMIILCPAMLIPVKGHKYLIQACDNLRRRGLDFELWLAGQGDLRSELESQVARLQLQDRVRFLGQVPHEQLTQFYQERKVDLVVLPSIDLGKGVHEGTPVALMEAMGYAIPVVSTVTGGIPELLDGGAGIVVPPEDPLALADAIERLANDPGLREQISREGRKRIEEKFCVEKVVNELVALFKCAGYGARGAPSDGVPVLGEKEPHDLRDAAATKEPHQAGDPEVR